MNRAIALIVFAVFLSGCKSSFVTHPYLQNPGQDQMTVMFETLVPGPTVRYREKGTQTFTVADTGVVKEGELLYRSKLSRLLPDTVYEYQVISTFSDSALYEFRTWPEHQASLNHKKIVLFSDSQGDHFWRLGWITNRGIINKECTDGLVENCVNEIAAIVVPGDIVSTGDNQLQWRTQFFDQIKSISPYVPILPAIGNHDQPNSMWKHYFEVPTNGELSFNEQWYQVDYGNIRWVTMDTNINGTSDEAALQHQWLDDLLAITANDESIDFLLMQFHHPCKSVFWVPGEKDLSCEFVAKLEQFTKDTGKPSGHFFGHTHAYSRGNSRDVKHLWTNVASSSGNIDYWGEYEQRDYDEFYMNFDEYGFSTLHILQDEKEGLRLVRRSGGQDLLYYDFVDDKIRDDITVYVSSRPPVMPVAISPNQETVSVNNVLLEGSDFESNANASHLESHWQIEDVSSGEVNDIWGNQTRSVHYWFDQNTQEGVDITKVAYNDLVVGNDYRWRVRYRDQHLEWSSWSEYSVFSTVE